MKLKKLKGKWKKLKGKWKNKLKNKEIKERNFKNFHGSPMMIHLIIIKDNFKNLES